MSELYQIIHVEGRRPLFLKMHLQYLRKQWEELFDAMLSIDPQQIEQRIVEYLDKEKYARDRAHYATVVVTAEGKILISAEGNSYYRGYALRVLRPRGIELEFETPFDTIPSLARQKAWELANSIARSRGAHIAIRTDYDGVLHEADGAQLFAVMGRRIVSSREPYGVEGFLALKAFERAGYRFQVEEFTAEDLGSIDELFYVDHRGVTALESYRSRPLMAIFARKVADMLNEFVPKV